MRWKGNRESENVEDQRRMPPPAVMAGGGIGTLVLILVIYLLGGDPKPLLQQAQQQAQQQPQGPGGAGPGAPPADPAEQEKVEFVKVVLADTEDVWDDLFSKAGRGYVKPHLVLFSGQTRSACGFADAAVGPFYCPGDSKVYIDLEFFNELQSRFRSPATSPARTSWPMRSATTSRTCSASRRRSAASRLRWARPRRTGSP